MPVTDAVRAAVAGIKNVLLVILVLTVLLPFAINEVLDEPATVIVEFAGKPWTELTICTLPPALSVP